MAKKKAPARRAPEERLRRNKTDYPLGVGQSLTVHGIPDDVLAAARERALVKRVALRWVLIRLLDRYGKGTVSP